MSHDVFISYAAKDKSVADAVCKALEEGGVSCWYAPRNVPYAVDYEEAIIDAISESKLMLLVLSEHANSSTHVKREVQNACREEPQIPVLPFQIADVTLSKSFRYYLGSVQWLVASTPPLEAHLRKLVNYVQQRLPQPEQAEIVKKDEEEARREAVERQHQEEEEKRRQEAEAQRRKEEEGKPARVESLWPEIIQEVWERRLNERQLAVEEERKRADAPTTEGATPEPKEPPLGTLSASPPEKVVSGDSAAPPVAAMRESFYRRIVFLVFTFVGVAGLIIAFILGPREYRGEQTAVNNNQTPASNSNPLIQTNRDTKAASTPPAGTVVGDFLGMQFVYVPAGSFMMGSEKGELDEKPVHQVTFSDGFYLGRYEVTQAQWRSVTGTNPSKFKDCDQCPVETVSWNEVQEFIRKLNVRSALFTYRLPSEAEWEYACRAGTTTEFAFGNSLSSKQANFDGTVPYGGASVNIYREKTTPVGSFNPNAWGLYDMHGNVWEWCEDQYHENYAGAPADGSAWLGLSPPSYLTIRGGSWFNFGKFLRSGKRDRASNGIASGQLGLRLVAVPRP
jgi:formylglycine-generating enzyme required for sulfatase activity